MTTASAINAGTPLLDQGIRAVNFFNGRLVTSGDLSRDQQARREGDARLGQANGSGIVHGLEVTLAGQPADRRLAVKAGLAVNAGGQTLCLGADQVLALVPAADADPPETGGGFGACAQLSGGTYVAGDGLYIVTLAPVLRPEGRAPVLALEPGNVRCNTDVMVEAVQLRMLRIGAALLDAHGLDTSAIGDAPVSRLRSSVAAACFGLPQRHAAHGAPGSASAPGLLEDMRERGLAQCDVPLALVFLTASGGIRFVDRWAVRRRVASGIAAPPWSAWLGEPLDAVQQAQLGQFQEQLNDIPAASLAGLQAANWFTWLPPAGFLKTATAAIAWEAFLGNRKPARTVTLAPGDAPAVLAEALRRDAVPIATGSTPSFRVYAITGGPHLFVRNAANARHAAEVWFDGVDAGMPEVADVQAAIARLWTRSCVQVVLRPGMGRAQAQAMIDAVPAGQPLVLCIEPGEIQLDQALRVAGKGHVSVHGQGPASLLRATSGEAALQIESCLSASVCDVALRAADVTVGGGSGLRGALTVLDTPDVRLERVSARCGNGTRLGASAIVVMHRGAESGQPRRVQVQDCRLLVGSGQQGLACIHCESSVIRGNSVRAVDEDRPMLRGIVVAGEVAQDVLVDDNEVGPAMQGINVALSRAEERAGEPLFVGRASVRGNRVRLARAEGDFEESQRRVQGLFFGHVRLLLVFENRIEAAEMGGTARGLYLHGEYGPHFKLRDNDISGLQLAIVVEALGTLPRGREGCLWLVEKNVIHGGKSEVEAPQAVQDCLRLRLNAVVPS